MRHYNLPPNIWLAQAALTEELYTEKQQQILPLQRNVTISDAIKSILVMITSHDIVRIANCLKISKTKIDLIAVSVLRPLVLLTYVHNNSIHILVTKKLAEYIVNEYCINIVVSLESSCIYHHTV